MSTTKSDFKWAFFGDMQMPYTDYRALKLVVKVLRSWKPDAIDIVGDGPDCLEYSSFSDGTTDEFFNKLKKEKQLEGESDEDFRIRVSPLPHVVDSQKEYAKFLKDLRRSHKDANIHYSIGNHEQRVWKYVNKKAPDFYEAVTPNTLWGVDDLGITWQPYENPPIERFAGIHVHHGATVTSAGLSVKNDIEKYGISLVRGHDHRGGVVYNTFPMRNETLVGMGTGHLCAPGSYGIQYTVDPSWELGFGIAHIVDNQPHLQFIRITPDYKCVLDGKVFHG